MQQSSSAHYEEQPHLSGPTDIFTACTAITTRLYSHEHVAIGPLSKFGCYIQLEPLCSDTGQLLLQKSHGRRQMPKSLTHSSSFYYTTRRVLSRAKAFCGSKPGGHCCQALLPQVLMHSTLQRERRGEKRTGEDQTHTTKNTTTVPAIQSE